MVKKTFTVDGMHCTSCAMVIESDLEDAGVKARCNYAKQILDVEFDEQVVTEKMITKVVAQSGYKIK